LPSKFKIEHNSIHKERSVLNGRA